MTNTKTNEVEYIYGPQCGLRAILADNADIIYLGVGNKGHCYERSKVEPGKMIYVGKILKNEPIKK